MDDYVNGSIFKLPPQCAPDGRPWQSVDPDELFRFEIEDLDDDPCFARFCEVLRQY
jgi:hypothetical protein